MYLHQFKTSKSCLKRNLRVPRQVVTTYQFLLSIWELPLELHSFLLLNKDFASANRRHIFLERLVCIPLSKHFCHFCSRGAGWVTQTTIQHGPLLMQTQGRAGPLPWQAPLPQACIHFLFCFVSFVIPTGYHAK